MDLDFVTQQNIERYRKLSDIATDELRRRPIFRILVEVFRILVEERENLKRLERGDAKNSTEVMRVSK